MKSTSAVLPKMAAANDPAVVQPPGSMKTILLAAVWFGLVTGLVEGAGLWVLRQVHGLAGAASNLGASWEILWIAPLFDLLLFGVVGLVLALIGRRFPRFPAMSNSIFVFTFLACFDWLVMLLGGRIHIVAILILAIGLAVQSTRWLRKHQQALMRLWRKSTPWLAGATLLLFAILQGGSWLAERAAISSLPEASSGSPNILVIVVDALRADHLSSYGYPRPTSAHIDQIAHDGVTFDNAFSASSWTVPSHASLLTGRYPHDHKADAYVPLDDRYPTIGEALQARGYRTGGFSANFRVFNRLYGLGRGFQHFEDYFQSYANMAVNTVYGYFVEDYLLHRALGVKEKIDRKRASDINTSVLRWIDETPQKPFFVFINYFDAHDPYLPPQPYRTKFSQLTEPGGLINTNWAGNDLYAPMTPEQLQGEVDAYDGGIAYADDQIGYLLSELQSRGLADNTLVVITSDHGELFGEHGLLEHMNSLYREVIHVPLIFWWPGHLPAGQRVVQPVTNAALPATLLDLVGGERQAQFPGPSLAQLWEQPDLKPDWPDPVAEVAQLVGEPPQSLTAHGAMASVLSSEWQYIIHEKFGEELYDWSQDSHETVNRANDQAAQPILQRFRAILERHLAGVISPLARTQ